MGIALRLGIQIIALFDKGLRSHTGATFGGERLGHPFFERLPGHAQGQHGQRMAQVDYVIDTRAEKSSQSGQGQHHGKTPRKLFLLEIKQGKQPPVAPPTKPVFMKFPGIFKGDNVYKNLDFETGPVHY